MDGSAARSIAHLSGRVSPQLLANEHYVDLPGSLAGLFPLGRVKKGSMVLFEGAMSSGVTSVVLEFLASPAVQKSWTALVGFGNFGFLAAHEKGVDLGRTIFVPDPGKDLSKVIAVLVEAFAVVVVANPRFVPAGQIRNLAARVRAHKSIVAVVEHGVTGRNCSEAWASCSDYVLRASMTAMSGLGRGEGFIKARSLSLSLTGRRTGERAKVITVCV